MNAVWVSISDASTRSDVNYVKKKIAVWKAGAADREQIFN